MTGFELLVGPLPVAVALAASAECGRWLACRAAMRPRMIRSIGALFRLRGMPSRRCGRAARSATRHSIDSRRTSTAAKSASPEMVELLDVLSHGHMRIVFRKLSDERHALEIARPSGEHERVECETRSYLLHDLLHYAVEADAKLDGGFWGHLASGRTLTDMSDRTGMALAASAPEMATIEQIVGALSGALKGRSDVELVEGMRRFAAALGTTMPGWLTEELVAAVRGRMRGLVGRWKATPYGGAMDVEWPAQPGVAPALGRSAV